jgi:hypothetical protein
LKKGAGWFAAPLVLACRPRTLLGAVAFLLAQGDGLDLGQKKCAGLLQNDDYGQMSDDALH